MDALLALLSFFFQAEDGIRDLTVTGVQTCALPISQGNRIIFSSNRDGNHEIYVSDIGGEEISRLTNRTPDDKWPTWSPDGSRSEERRVGKECRSRWSA